MRTAILFVTFMVWAPAHALDLNAQQLSILANDMRSRPETATAVAANDAAWLLDFYNGQAGPEYYVWDETVEPDQYKGAIHWSEFDAISAAKRSSFEMLSGSGTLTLNATLPNVRAGINDIFSASTQTQTRADMEPVLRRIASEWERLQVGETGAEPGSFGNPGVAIWPGTLTLDNITDALALPLP